MKKNVIVLDRDGVINIDSPDYIKSPEEWIPIPGSIEAIAALSQAGFRVVLATNQSGLHRGLYSLETLNKIHEKMIMLIKAADGKLTGIYFCPHLPSENCGCRKPQPGMLLQIQQDFGIKNTDMIFIGDSVKDYEAAQKVGCAFMLVKTGNGKDSAVLLKDVPVFEDLAGAVKTLL